MAKSWAEKLADSLIYRKSYNYLDKPIEQLDRYVIKSSTSLSGAPHIGNASDVIRAEAVVRCLREVADNVEFIWVAEDMDPFRKVPSNVPPEFEKYLGMPAADMPCPDGCCKDYSEHFINLFMDEMRDHFDVNLTIYSMTKEYRKGVFAGLVKQALEKTEEIRKIQGKYAKQPMDASWTPYKPVCDSCGKIITSQVTGTEGDKVTYVCKDYPYQHRVIPGCGHEGASDISKGAGKLLWKQEWAMQWKHWGISFETYGKEHGVNCPHSKYKCDCGKKMVLEEKPSDAGYAKAYNVCECGKEKRLEGVGSFWVAGEIAERIYDYPEPCPTRGPNPVQPYEYVLVGGEKMSASRGNIVSAWGWREFAPQQALRYLFLTTPHAQKNFMNLGPQGRGLVDYDLDVPKLMDLVDGLESKSHMYWLIKGKPQFVGLSYLNAAKFWLNGWLYHKGEKIHDLQEGKSQEEMIATLQSQRMIPKEDLDEGQSSLLEQRLAHGRNWAERYSSEEYRWTILKCAEEQYNSLENGQKEFLLSVGKYLTSNPETSPEDLDTFIFDTAKAVELGSKKCFKAAYQVLYGKTRGQRLSTLLLGIAGALGPEWVQARFATGK